MKLLKNIWNSFKNGVQEGKRQLNRDEVKANTYAHWNTDVREIRDKPISGDALIWIKLAERNIGGN